MIYYGVAPGWVMAKGWFLHEPCDRWTWPPKLRCPKCGAPVPRDAKMKGAVAAALKGQWDQKG